jgi:subtilisin-like proprotein convertase family protein
MKRANFTNFLNASKQLLLAVLFLGTWYAAEAQTPPIPGICKTYTQRYQSPVNRILNTGVPLISGNAPLPAGSPGVLEIAAGPNTDHPSGAGGAVPPGHTIYKVSVNVGANLTRASEMDLLLGYNPPTAAGPAALTVGPNTRWVTLTSDNGGNAFVVFPTFDDDADPGSQIDFPTPQVNTNLVASREFTNIVSRIAPEEPLSQLSGLLATNAAGQGGVFFIAVRDDTPPPATAPSPFDGTLGSFAVTLTTIPTIEYAGPPFGSPVGTVAQGAKYTGTTNGGIATSNVNGGAFLPALPTMNTLNATTQVRARDYYSSASAPDSILNNATIAKSLSVPVGEGRVIMDVDVRVALRHTYMGDLAMSLTSPSGTTITLTNRRGGNIDLNPSPAYLNAAAIAQPATFPVPAAQRSSTGHIIFPSLIFSDESDSVTVNTTSMFGHPTAITIGSQTAIGFFGGLDVSTEPNDNVITDHDYKFSPNFPYASPGAANPRGFFQMTPEEGLGSLIGETPKGVWTLKITDNSGRDVGVFDRFDIAVTTIPKPCILDFANGGGGGCVDTVGTTTITGCSNQFPLQAILIQVDTLVGTRLTPKGVRVGTTIQLPAGNTVFNSGTGLTAATVNRDTTFSRNPRVIYRLDSLDIILPPALNGTTYPDPAAIAQPTTPANQLKIFTPTWAGPPVGPFFTTSTLPRHGLRIYPKVPPTQAYCRFPYQRIPNPLPPSLVPDPLLPLDQVPTDSFALAGGADARAPTARCKTDITISLDTVANAGIAIINPYNIDGGLTAIDDINGSSDDCTKRGKLQLLNLGGNFGTDCTPAAGIYRINYDNLNTKPALTACSDLTVNATHEIKIKESLAAITGSDFTKTYFIRTKRPTTVGAAPLGAIAVGDFKAIIKFILPNGSVVTRPYQNAAPIAAPPATGNFDIPLAYNSALPPPPNTAIIQDLRVETKFTLNSGKISNLAFDFGTVNRDSLRFTTFPRTVTCADIGKPTKIMLMVKDRTNKFDTCFTNVVVTDKVKPTITCGTNVSQTLATVNDCSWFLTQAQVTQLGPVATDNCLAPTSLRVPLSKPYSVAPAIGFIIENTTDKPLIVNSLNFPVLGNADMFIRAYVFPFINANPQFLDVATYPASTPLYPILNQNALVPTGPDKWLFWGQNIVKPAGPGTIAEVEFIPKNFSNLTLSPTAVTGNYGVPYNVSGDQNIGTSLIIPPGTLAAPTRWGVYIAAFGVNDGNPFPAANNTSFGIVHSNVVTGGITPSSPYPLPPTGSNANTYPPVIVRAGWNTTTAGTAGNEIDNAVQNTIANPAPPPFAPFTPVFEGVVNFPLGHALIQAAVPLPNAGGTVRMFAGKVNYTFGETKVYTPALGGAAGANTDVRNFILPTQGQRKTISYFQKNPIIPTPPSDFNPNKERSIFPYEAIKQISGIDYQKPYPIGKTVNVFQVTDMAGNTETCSQTVEILPAAGAVPPQLICNDLVNISLDAVCSDTLKATEFLANAVNSRCLGAFRVEIVNGTNVLGTQTGTYTGVPLKTLIGGTYDYKVIDAANTNNYCWGKVKFEDKFAPKLSCPENITVDDCSADIATAAELIYTGRYGNASSFSSNFAAGQGVSSAIVSVDAPAGAKIVSLTVETDLSISTSQIGRITYKIVSPSGGVILLAAQPGINTTTNPTVCPNTGFFQYNFSDAATQPSLTAASNYPCAPPAGTYLSLEDLNGNLAGSPVSGDWLFQFEETQPGNTGAGAVTSKIGGLRLKIVMTVPIENALVQELCTDNLVPLLTEATSTKNCTQDTAIVKIVKRTFTAKDNYNNISNCSHTISFKRAKFADQVFPGDLVFDCTYSDLKANPTDTFAIDNAIAAGATITKSYKGPWFDSKGNPHPNVTGKPRPFTCSSYNVNYTDMRIDDICGTGNGSYAVRRTWKVYDACANKAIEREQYISVRDIVAPTITAATDLTFSTPVAGCIASVTLPKPTITDNCSAVSDVDVVYEVFNESNFLTTVGTQSATNPNVFNNIPTSPIRSSGGILQESFYFVRYTATDKCGNTTTATSRFKVTDLIPPVAVCPPLVKVSLTSDGNAILNAQEFDRGSYDNCGGIAKMQVWRLDDSDCVTEDANKDGDLNDEVDIDGDGFGDYSELEYYKHPQNKVRFCCEDIGDTIMVAFRVWDFSPRRLTNGFRPTDINYDYGNGNNGNVNVCMSRVVIEDKLPPVIYTENKEVICGNEVLGKQWLDEHKPQPQLPSKGIDGKSANLFYSDAAAKIYSHPDSFTTVIVVPVNGLDTVRDINVSLKFHHTNLGNLSATVTSPNGTTVDLFIQPTSENSNPYASPTINGVPATNIFRLTFNDEPSINPANLPQFSSIVGVPDTITRANLGLINGKYTAAGQLSAFDGQNPNGDWIIRISRLDPTAIDSGAVVKGGAQIEIQAARKTKNLSYYYDNCDDVLLCSTDTVRINNCGNGTVKRAWELTDAGGRTVKTNQIYTSTGRSYYSVLFPQDTILTCEKGSTDTSYTGKPKVNILGGCPTVAVAYKDDIVSAVTNACYRIKRTWKVANLCQNGMMKGRSNTNTPDVALMQSTLPSRLYKNGSDSTNTTTYPTFDTDGYVEYVQIISVNDKTPPVITDFPTEIKIEPVGKECKVKITIPAIKATDVCSNEFKMSWSILNKATKAVIVTDSSKAFPGSYSFNSSSFGTTFIVRYIVTDLCGNYAVKDYDVTPKDVVKPSPVCYQGLSADILPTTGNVMLTAKQFDAGSFDANDCTAKNNLRFFIERGTPGFGNAVPTSEMVIINCKGIVPIRLWVVDAAGNADYCDTYVDVQNNMGAVGIVNCDTVKVTGTKVMTTLLTLKNQVIKNANVKVDYTTGFVMANFKNDIYEALVNPQPAKLNITVEKNDNPLNGVSTFDLVLLTKHVLATQPITDPYLKIAGDVNNNGKITTADIVELRKMILAIQTGFSNNKSWRFFAKGTFNEMLTINNPTAEERNNFLGIKIGDINTSANSASPKSTGTFTFDVNEKVFAAGEEVKATFNAAKIAQMEGYQFTLGYDKDALELANIEGSNENFGMVENGSITSSWNGNAENGSNLFTLVFKAKKAGSLSEVLNINSKYTNAEAYTKTGDYNNVALQFNGASNKFALYQNQPNPFMGRTVVGFSLPVADHAKMTIYDMAGRLVKTVEGNFNKGYNEVIIDEILGSGVLNYKLETSTETATKSMIILE